MGNSPIEKCPTARMFSLPTLIEKVKPVVLVKYEIEHREQLKSECFFWNFRTIKILMQEGKTMTF